MTGETKLMQDALTGGGTAAGVEAIARIIDPKAWEDRDGYMQDTGRVASWDRTAETLTKANAILAALAAPPTPRGETSIAAHATEHDGMIYCHWDLAGDESQPIIMSKEIAAEFQTELAAALSTPRAEIGDEARELIKRLRDCANGVGSFKSDKGDYGICDDAADALEAAFAAATPAPVVGDGECDCAARFYGDDRNAHQLSCATFATTPASVTPDAGELERFSEHTNWELSHYSAMYGDDDDQSVEWRVHQINGGVNDREWTLIGAGETAAQAIAAALTAASHAEDGKGEAS